MQMRQHIHSNRTVPRGCCGASHRSHVAWSVSRPSRASHDAFTAHHRGPKHPQRQRYLSIIPHAQQAPDKGSVAALEAALGAINNILGTYNKVKGSKPTTGDTPAPGKGTGSNKSRAAASTGPSKLITFSAKASGSVPVKELLSTSHPSTDNVVHIEPHSSSSTSTSSSSSHSKQPHTHSHHKPKHPYSHLQKRPQQHSSTSNSSTSSWLQQLAGKQHSGNIAKDGTVLPDEALSKSLQAYLSLPLEQYSVLDPKLITRLPDGADVEATLAQLLAEQKARRTARKASRQLQSQQQGQVQHQQQHGLGAILDDAVSSSDNSSSGGSNSGTSLQPTMRQLQTPGPGAAEHSGSSSNGVIDSAAVPLADSTGSSSSSVAAGTTAASITTAQGHVADTAAADTPDGAFLLQIPVMELLGVDLEPLLVVYVDIDDKRGQVKFRASRLVIGDERFDQEFKVDLLATMSSKVTQPAVEVLQDSSAAAEALSGETVVTTGSISATASSEQGSGQSAPTTAAQGSIAVAGTAANTAAGREQVWQRGSVLGCKVKLSMTLRLPHPLSIVPGPLLSTTAGLVAKLVMQALLPSFLELLATDYGRWATGSSTAARQALPAGSLVAAEKQPLTPVQ